MTKPEFNVGDRVAWKYGVGKGTGHIAEKLTKATKLYGKNFKATAEEPKYRIKSDKGKDLIRNPETLEMLKESSGGDGEAEEKGEDAGEKDEEIEDVEGDENDDEEEAKEGRTMIDKEHEVGGQPLQQMPGAEMKNDMVSGKSIPYLENVNESLDLTKSEVHYPGIARALVENGDEKDVVMEEVKTDLNGSEKDVPHGLPHEEVPQPDLDAVK